MMRIIKTIAVPFLVMCFLIEDTVDLFSLHKNTVCCFSDTDKEDSSESNEKDSEEKKDGHKILHYNTHFLYSTINESKFRLSEERIYAEHFLEINSPPPDFI
jgi:hypothetical protein